MMMKRNYLLFILLIVPQFVFHKKLQLSALQSWVLTK
jgi:hypothetical protein